MTNDEYLATQNRMIEIGKEIQKLKLEEFLECNAYAETVGPFVDPVLFRNAHDNLTAIRFLAHSLTTVTIAMRQLQTSVIETHMREMKLNPGSKWPDLV